MQKRRLGRTSLDIAPVVFGGNVFGWTIDEKTSFDLLDRFVAAGLNAIDTADVYSRWAPGHAGGESETIIGRWMKARGNRDEVVVVTKVGSDMGQGKRDLSAGYITKAVEDSLRRLQTDRIDLYLSHWPDPTTPHEETLGAFARLVEAGKVRHIGTSNLDAEQLSASLKAARDNGLPRYDVLQPEYNLYSRNAFEGPLADLCIAEEIGVISYYALAAGFLSGKYRSAADLDQSVRGGGMKKYMDPRGFAILGALDEVASRHAASPAEIAIAWVAAQPGVTAPIASATSAAQLDSLVKAASLDLSRDDLVVLDTASRPGRT